MIIHNLVQGSPEWHAHREQYDNASEVSAAASKSKYKSRAALQHQYATGLRAEVDAATQKRFDDGHRAEALARPLAEAVIDGELYPITASDGALSASFDGLTLNYDLNWEHKALNDEIRACETGDDLDEHYKLQMDQQCLIAGIDTTLFSATKWEKSQTPTEHVLVEIIDGVEVTTYYNLIEAKHLWYTTTPERKQAVIDIWAQFHRDLANYTPPVVAEKLEAKTIEGLPTLFIQAVGEITTNNMKEYGQALAKRLSDVRAIQLVTDQDFVDAKAAAKHLRDSIEQAKQAKEAMLSQTVTVGEAARMIDAWCEDMRKTALKLESDVETQDKIKKTKMITEAKEKFTGIIAALEAETAPIRILETTPDFANTIKGKRNYDSMQGAINDLLANAELHVNNLAKDLRAKLTWFKSLDCQFPIFADLQTLIYKQADDFKLAVNARIAEHEKALQEAAEKAIAIRAKVEADAAARQAEFNAKLEIAAKEEFKQKPGAADLSNSPINNLINEADFSKHVIGVDPAAGEDKTVVTNIGKRPTAEAIINLVATTYSVDKPTAQRWLTQSFAQAKAA